MERLEDERLDALTDRIDCELALGRHYELTSELESLVKQYPLRERLRAQLMLALYRSGRQADALIAYQNARRTLVEELGLEPGEELQRLERAILQHDAELDLPPTAPPSNLPAPASSFVGRATELANLEGLLRTVGVRLVTITGLGGVGKTRLALAACQQLVDAFPDGLFFAPLASIQDANLVPAAITDAIGAARTPREAPRDALLRALHGRQTLLVLDNLEHLPEAAPLVAELLTSTPTINILVTSSEPLHLSGEHLYTLDPLTESDAIELFETRARAKRDDFQADDTVASICSILDRLPLAIELAAAQVNVLSPSLIAARLERQLPFPSSGQRDAPQRQQTLRATMNWSYGLLTPEEQRLFRSLAVFAGGCTLEAARRVCDADLETLASLVDKSLVRRVEDRYAMLRTVREYATERLQHHGEHEAAMQRLADYVVTLPDGSPMDLLIAPRVLELGQELDNVRSAFAWALATGQSSLALRLASEAYWFMSGNGNLLAEVSQWLDAALAFASSAPVPLRAYALTMRAQIAYDLGNFGDANTLAARSLALYRAIEHSGGSINALRGLGTIARARGDHARARGWYEESLALASRTSDVQKVSYALKGLADLERELGNLGEAAALLERSASLARDAGDQMILTYILHGAGDVALANGDPAGAADLYRESLRLSHELGIWRPVVHCVAGLAAAAADAGDAGRAGQLWGAREALERELGWRILPYERAQYVGAITACLKAEPIAFQSAAVRGGQMTLSVIIESALGWQPPP